MYVCMYVFIYLFIHSFIYFCPSVCMHIYACMYSALHHSFRDFKPVDPELQVRLKMKVLGKSWDVLFRIHSSW